MRWLPVPFPFLQSIPPERILKILAAGEVVTGVLLLAPLVPNAVAGAALAGFSGSLLAMYARTPSLRKPGSVWPAPAGIAISKDVWMLARSRAAHPGGQTTGHLDIGDDRSPGLITAE